MYNVSQRYFLFFLRCFCGMGYETEAMARECKCRRKCTGNKKKRCGGSVHTSLYNTCKFEQLHATILTNKAATVAAAAAAAAAIMLVSLQCICSLQTQTDFRLLLQCMLFETYLGFLQVQSVIVAKISLQQV